MRSLMSPVMLQRKRTDWEGFALVMVGRRQTHLLWDSEDPSSTVGQTDNPPPQMDTCFTSSKKTIPNRYETTKD